MDASGPRARLRIGEWIADPATNELARGTERVRLEPRAMDVLVFLAGRAGAVVTREELFAAAWPGTVVGDEALSQGVTKLRRALGDDSRAPAYIETISKRGYRLLAPVSGDTEAPAAAPARPRHLWMGVAAAVALVVLIAAGIHFSAAPPEPAPIADERPGPWVTLTVLPFESLGAADQAYLARGISEELMTGLAGLSGLRVIRASGPTAANAGGYVASGTVQREGDTLRLNVHLVDARTREQLWSQRFERPFGDVFAVQDDVIRRLTESLRAKVSDAERVRLAKRHTRSLEAYDAFLRAQALFLARGARENEEARVFYRKALEHDPKFARAYAGLAMTHAIEFRLQPGTEARPGLERAFELAESARLIDPDLAQVHWALAFVHAQSRRHEQALAALRKAIELDPSFADAYALMAGVHTYLGEPAKSIPLIRTALRFNPEAGYLYYVVLGRAYVLLGDHEQALINLREALVRNPADLEARILHAAALAAAGDRAAADWEAEEIRMLERGFSAERWLDTYPLTSSAHRTRLRTLLAPL